MAFLPGFEHDVFISYSHVDNVGDEWVTHFHEQLDIALARRVGRMGVVKLWRDKRVSGEQLFDKTIKSAVTGSALFLAVTSNGYLKSDYCQHELACFYDKASAERLGLQIGDRSRIYNLLLARIPPERWPQQFPRTTGFPFHAPVDSGSDDDDFVPPTDLAIDPQLYRRQIGGFANALYKMLEAFQKAIGEAASPGASAGPPSAPAKPKVFLADVTDTLAPVRNRLVRELERKSITVATRVPPPYEPTEHDARVEKATQNALLSIHLLDGSPGREIDNTLGETYPLRQLAVARQRVKSQLIWVPSDLDTAKVEDETYRNTLHGLEHDERTGQSYNFVRGSKSALASQIIEKLDQLQQSRAAPAVPTCSVLLDTHIKDQLYALEIGRLLLARSVQPYINPQDDPNGDLDAFESRLRRVTSLVILFGQVDETWVRSRLGVAVQLSIAKNLPLKQLFVFFLPPVKAVDAARFHVGPVSVRVLDHSGSPALDPEAVGPLCVDEVSGSAA